MFVKKAKSEFHVKKKVFLYFQRIDKNYIQIMCDYNYFCKTCGL